MGNVYNRLILCKALIARELTCCKIFVRHLALRYLPRDLKSVSRVGMGVGTGTARAAAAAPTFLPIIKSDNCPQGIKD